MKHQGASVGVQVRVLDDEFIDGQAKMPCNSFRLAEAQSDEARPAAAIAATLANIERVAHDGM